MIKQQKEKIIEIASQYQFVIWDWNGTILNDSSITCEVNNILLKEYKLPEISLEDYRNTFGHPVQSYYEKIGFDFKLVDFAEVGQKFIFHYTEKLKTAGLFEEAKNILSSLKEKNIKQFVLSAAYQEHLASLVKNYNLESYFEAVFGISDIYAKCKKQRGRELIEEHGLSSAGRGLLVGDTDHDFEVAEELGVDILLIANGHQSRERLQKLKVRVI